MTIDIKSVSGSAPATYVGASAPTPAVSNAASVAQNAPTQAQTQTQRDAAAEANAASAAAAAAAKAAGRLQINVDVQTNQLVIQVVNGQTTELIRRIPEEDVAEFAQLLGSPTGNLVKASA